jgi:heat shock protein HtpX
MKTCPKCGYEKNRDGALMCSLCGGVFPEAQQKVESRLAQEEAFAEFGASDAPFKRMDFAVEMAYNRRQSALLLVCFLALLALMGWAIGFYYGSEQIGIALAVVLALVYLLVSYYAGDKAILTFSNARPADPERDQQLINIVDEVRIAAGQPMPKVYVMETDAANAFATGRDPAHASVAVTRGLMNILNREELQGVMAHEMSHVRNYDIRYMMLVTALVGAVALLADGLRRSMWWGGGGRRGSRRFSGRGGGQAQLILLVVALLAAILAPLFATMLQMAISRKREFLADASAVELTRNPLGLASALEKLDHHVDRTPLDAANRATQHLYIVNPLKRFGQQSGALFSTHPPIEARIRLLRAMA